MRELVLKISPDGKDVVSLFSEVFPVGFLGIVNITRATDVRFDNECGKWEIYIIQERRVLPEKFTKRSEAIEHEVEYLNERLNLCPL